MAKMEQTGLWARLGIMIIILGLIIGCTKDPKPSNQSPEKVVVKKNVKIPAAHADSLFSFVQNQLDFGHRIPGTKEHKACKDWLVAKLKSYGAKVKVQNFKASFLGHKNQQSYNIIAQFNPNHSRRVLLGAHWDSRLIAEKDSDKVKQNDPIDGANDGGSGVAALLEIARQINQQPIDLGVDIILFDAEDNGESSGLDNKSWCLGSQYWSKNKMPKNYNAKFGILLDMVGAKNSLFHKEGYSRVYAKNYTDKIWQLAKRMGNADLFVDQNGDPITDDHKYVNEIAKIPMVDIIDYRQGENKFAAYHHTHDDNIDIIDKNTLRRVTQIVLAVIYNESGGRF